MIALGARPRRALLFMPGDDRRKIEKGAALGVDAVVMDLEDGVAVNRKQVARETVLRALQTIEFGRTERLVRLNGAATGLAEDDLAQTVEGRPDGYVLPKVDSPDVVHAVGAQLESIERAHNWPICSIRLLAIIESARGVLKLDEIAAADPRLDALIFGAEDLAADLGATRTREGWEIFHARSAVVIAARAYGIDAIDMIFVDLQDLEGLREETRRAAQMGYSGKLAIHPHQVPVIAEAFTPSQEEVEQAARLVAAYEENQKAGAGAFAFEGKMVDLPMVRAAQHILSRARNG